MRICKPATAANRSRAEFVHAPRNPLYLVLRGELAGYVFGLYMDNPGPVSDTVRILRELAGPDDLIYSTYEQESVYFYTRLPTTGRIHPDNPVYAIARAHHLPEYLFDALEADWVVWRTISGNRRVPPELLAKLIRALRARGRTVREVARFKETGWENRNNLHHHRFPVLGYLYTFTPDFPDAMIFKVEGKRKAEETPAVAP
jgi:Rad3-related DNA helicase